MDAEPWNADLLDWLASDFARHGYDLKYLLKELMTSKAYQMSAVASVERKDSSYQFHGPLPRRITAEEFVDTVSAVTGEWRTLASGDSSRYVRDWQMKSSPLTRAMGRPIRDQVFISRGDAANDVSRRWNWSNRLAPQPTATAAARGDCLIELPSASAVPIRLCKVVHKGTVRRSMSISLKSSSCGS